MKNLQLHSIDQGTARMTAHPEKVQPTTIAMHERQTPLTDLYQREPQRALIADSASTSSQVVPVTDPLHGQVTTAGHGIDIGVHPAVGGDGDGPIPGELLAAALASCLDSTLRIIANRLGIQLRRLAVTATGEVDVRGTLMVSPDVPVGFLGFQLTVDLEAEPGTRPAMLKALANAAEASCVVMQTLRNGTGVATQFNIDCE